MRDEVFNANGQLNLLVSSQLASADQSRKIKSLSNETEGHRTELVIVQIGNGEGAADRLMRDQPQQQLNLVYI